jgi:hypothetical protein
MNKVSYGPSLTGAHFYSQIEKKVAKHMNECALTWRIPSFCLLARKNNSLCTTALSHYGCSVSLVP